MRTERPLASGVPVVRWLEAGWGGVQDENESGAPCVELGAVQGA